MINSLVTVLLSCHIVSYLFWQLMTPRLCAAAKCFLRLSTIDITSYSHLFSYISSKQWTKRPTAGSGPLSVCRAPAEQSFIHSGRAERTFMCAYVWTEVRGAQGSFNHNIIAPRGCCITSKRAELLVADRQTF